VDAATDLADARRFLERARERAHIQAFVLAGRPDRTQAVIGGFFSISAALSLSVAGVALEGDALFRAADDLRQLGRQLAPEVSLAIVSLEEWLGTTMGLYPPARSGRRRTARSHRPCTRCATNCCLTPTRTRCWGQATCVAWEALPRVASPSWRSRRGRRRDLREWDPHGMGGRRRAVAPAPHWHPA